MTTTFWGNHGAFYSAIFFQFFQPPEKQSHFLFCHKHLSLKYLSHCNSSFNQFLAGKHPINQFVSAYTNPNKYITDAPFTRKKTDAPLRFLSQKSSADSASAAVKRFLVNYSVTELPEHLNRGGIPPFSGCVHDTTTVYSFELYSYFYDFRCFQSGHGQFFFYSGYGEIFSQDIICADSIRIIILLSISV